MARKTTTTTIITNGTALTYELTQLGSYDAGVIQLRLARVIGVLLRENAESQGKNRGDLELINLFIGALSTLSDADYRLICDLCYKHAHIKSRSGDITALAECANEHFAGDPAANLEFLAWALVENFRNFTKSGKSPSLRDRLAARFSSFQDLEKSNS